MANTIDKEYTDTYIINKSKFISFACPVINEKACKDFLESIRQKYSDATHLCYGYTLSSPRIERCSDDGEPSGTAGKPILELLKKKKLENVLVAVVRYFGGKKLGAGGLIRAYTNSAKLVVDMAQVVKLITYIHCRAVVNLSECERLKNEILLNNGRINSIDYLDKAVIDFEVPNDILKFKNMEVE